MDSPAQKASESRPDSLVGQQVGHYRVIRKLGEGGMGAVFEAVHEQIGKRAAIKVLHAQYSKDPEFARRFFNEARAVNLVQHSGLVNIFEFGQLPDGAAYIVMDFLDGETLSARLKRSGGKLGLEGLTLMRQIASALAAAHGKGIIHRDLKPANVIIVPEPEAPGGERAKILDFGVAKMGVEAARAEGRGEEEAPVTRTGVFMGTPKYMAPEQCRGAGHVDDKADVYSLGCILYQSLAGRPPFTAPGEGEIMAMHIFATPRPLRDVDSNVPEPLAALTHAMLAKKPEERPSMSQVAMELGRFTGAFTGAMPAVSLSGAFAQPGAGSPRGALTLSGGGLSPPPGPVEVPRENSQTLGGAVGQTASPTRVRSRVRLAVLLGAPLLAAAAAALLLGSKAPPAPAEQPPRAAAAPPAPRVRWHIESDPPGAQVLREADGVVLGATPWKAEEARGAGVVTVVLRKAGFADRKVVLDRGTDASRSERLEPQGPQAPAPADGASTLAAKAAAAKAAAAKAAAARGKRRPGRPRIDTNKELDDDDIPLVK